MHRGFFFARLETHAGLITPHSYLHSNYYSNFCLISVHLPRGNAKVRLSEHLIRVIYLGGIRRRRKFWGGGGQEESWGAMKQEGRNCRCRLASSKVKWRENKFSTELCFILNRFLTRIIHLLRRFSELQDENEIFFIQFAAFIKFTKMLKIPDNQHTKT